MRRFAPLALSFVALSIVGCGSDEDNPAPVEVDTGTVVADSAAPPMDVTIADSAEDTTVGDGTVGDGAVTDGATTDGTSDAPDVSADSSTPASDASLDADAASADASDAASADATDAANDAATDAAEVSSDAGLPALPNAEIWVSRVGDGSTTLTSGTSAAAFVVRYKLPEKTVLGTLSMPTILSGSNKAFALSGTATSEGHLLRSGNGAYVTMIGYDAAPGVATVVTAATLRTIARIDASGTIDTSTTTTSYAGEVVRSAVTSDGTQYWLTGDDDAGNFGISYVAGHGGSTAATAISTGFDSLRVVNIFGGALWGTGGQVRIFDFGGTLPTTATAPTSVTSATGGSAYGIVGFDLDAVAGIDTLYVCDDGSFANGGGVRRWKRGSGTPPFSSVTQLSGGLSTTVGCRGLSGMVVGSDVVLFVVTGENPSRVGVMVDVGGAAATATFDPIATAATNSQFRGVALKPL